MNKKIEFNFRNIIILIIVICIFSSTSSYISTSYAITENGYAVHSENVEYTDNSKLGVTQVQAAIDGTCAKIDTRLASLEQSNFLNSHPVGSIYLTVSANESTPEKIEELYGGEWEKFGEGRTLIGVGSSTDDSNNTTTISSVNTKGGEALSKVPEHTHTYLKSNSTTGSTILTVDQIPSHNHPMSVANEGTTQTTLLSTSAVIYRYQNNYTSYLGSLWTGSQGGGQGHDHSISTTSTSTGKAGVTSASNIQPYISVYMYRRVA